MQRCSARQLAWALAAAAAAGLGCASRHAPGPSSDSGPPLAVVGNQGGSWELVLPGGGTGPALAAGPESARRDAELGRAGESVLEDAAWPDPRAASLDRLRRVWVNDDPRSLHYYRAVPPWYPPPPHRYRGW